MAQAAASRFLPGSDPDDGEDEPAADAGPISAASGPGRLVRAEALLATARLREALALLAPGAGDPPADQARAAALRGMALLGLQRHAEAREAALAARASGAGDAGTDAAADLVLARVAARQGRAAVAAALYRRLAGLRLPVPGLSPRAQRELPEDASFLAAWLPYDAGRHAEAARSLTAWLRAHRGSRRADDARWFAAWSLVRAGARAEGRAALARLASGRYQDAALYWMARLGDDRAEQLRLYRRARQASGPEGWYGQLAAARLAALGAPPGPWALPEGAPPGDGPGPGAAGEALARAAALLAAGRQAEAGAALRELAASRRAGAAPARLAQLAAAAGAPGLALRVARDHLPLTRRSLRWLHPDPWAGAPAAAGADRRLLLALIRRESGFRPRARSAAGAVGLLQLLPSTAERLAALAGLPAAAADLGDPEGSRALGALYLALLQDRFGHPAAALAAYNAGPVPAAAWARDLAGQPLDAWVENLPFRETRRYVKAVLADAGVYRWLEEGETPAIDGLAPVPGPREGVGF